jgi:MFS family permease
MIYMITDVKKSAKISPTPAYKVLALLTLVYLIQAIDRQVVSVVIEPIRHEFNASDKVLGMVGGLGYAVTFALAALPLGRLIDRVNRVRLLAWILAIWSGMTTLSGLATNLTFLVVARMGVGAAEAGAAPSVMSLLADTFAPRRRSFAIGVCYVSNAAGIAASFLIGSLVARAYGWRAAFWVAGVPGLLLATLFPALIREPVRGASEADGPASVARDDVPAFRSILCEIWSNRVLLNLVIAMSLAALVFQSLWVWCTSILIRYHHIELPEAGRIVAFAAIFQAAGSWAGGFAAGRFARRSAASYGLVAGGCAILTVPFGIGFALAPSKDVAIICICAMTFFNAGWTGPGYGLAMTVVQPRMRGVVASFIVLSATLVSTGIGPVFTGGISDALSGNLRTALAVTFSINVWAALHFSLAALSARRILENSSGNPPVAITYSGVH